MRSKDFRKAMRILLYYMTFSLIWLIWSAAPLFREEHTSFQAAGSIIVVWSIIFIARDRLKYERSYRVTKDNHIIAALDRLEELRQFQDLRLHFNFDLLKLQIARNAYAANAHNVIGPNDEEGIEAMALALQNERDAHKNPFTPKNEKSFLETRQELLDWQETYAPWHQRIALVEVVFLVIGTLQWGYGDRFSMWFSEELLPHIPPLFTEVVSNPVDFVRRRY